MRATAALLLWFAVAAYAQPVTVPFVGCSSENQAGALPAPTGFPVVVSIQPEIARRLAYYDAFGTGGVLAPRGWTCFAFSGSSSQTVVVVPGDTNRYPDRIKGPAILLTITSGGGSGGFELLEMIQRYFPSYGWIMPPEMTPPRPYPADTVVRRTTLLVEYRTPAGQEGIGIQAWMAVGEIPVRGIVLLSGSRPDVVRLSVRLPSDLDGLAATIIDQVEADAGRAEPSR